MPIAIDNTIGGITAWFSRINTSTILNIVGWIVFLILLIGGGYWYWTYSKNKKLFNKRITAFELVGGIWTPSIRDVAKTVKIGKGGFEILYLKKTKTWKIAYGGRVGRLDYYFFIMPDGYWYNGVLLGNLNAIDETGGLIPVGTTNPLMRGNYTALEKQIDALHGEKKSFWQEYGNYILSLAFVLIAGVMLWLMFKEFSTVSGNLAEAVKQMGEVLKSLSNLASNVQGGGGNSGLIPA